MPDQKFDPNDVAAALGPGGLRKMVEAKKIEALYQAAQALGLQSAREMEGRYHGQLREPIIEGLLRAGETMNFIAPPKVGKSFLVNHLALTVAAGKAWLSPLWFCPQGPVIIIDNELHEETVSYRLTKVREAMGLPREVEDLVFVVCMRGRWKPLAELKDLVLFVRHIRPRLLIIDPLYRFLPEGTSENDNAEMAQVYNQLDAFAALLDTCGVVIVHHASKGGQGNKGVTDVGSGAGSQARATDTHVVLREHEKEGHFVAEAAVRSWPPPKPLVLKWEFPLWALTEHDPDKLKGKIAMNRHHNPAPDELDDAAFLTYLVPGEWRTRTQIAEAMLKREGYTRSATRGLLEGVIARHGLDELTATDGVKDCGDFLADRPKGGHKFRLKGPGEPTAPEKPAEADNA